MRINVAHEHHLEKWGIYPVSLLTEFFTRPLPLVVPVTNPVTYHEPARL